MDCTVLALGQSRLLQAQEVSMVHIPNENDPPQPQQRPVGKPLPKAAPQRPATGENRRPPTGESRQPTGEAKRPPTGEQPRPKTGPVVRPPGNKQPTKPQPRATQMISMEPPRRNKGPALAKDIRIDALGGPKSISQRNKNLMGTIGRDKTQIMQRPGGAPALPPAEANRPTLKKPGDTGGAVDLGANSRKEMETMMRRKATRRIPKPGGGFMSDDAPLASMESGRQAPVPPQAPQNAAHALRQPADPAARINVPPRVDIPIPNAPHNVARRPDVAPPPPSSRANTLAGISAEDLLGAEGRRVLEDMRRREAEAPARGEHRDTRRVRQGGQPAQIQPGTQDSARRAFQGAEYGAPAPLEQPLSDELRPQNFMSGPQQPQNVVQTPQPAYEQATDAPPPPDDLGYERPVDFGDGSAPAAQGAYEQQQYSETVSEVVVEDNENPVARESQAHDEMEQRAGYLLWLQGVITIEEVQYALDSTDDTNEAVRDLLVNTGFTDQVTLYRFLARHESLAPVDFSVVQPAQRALACLRPAIARAYRVIPFAKLGELLLVAAAFPFDPKRLLELRRLTASKVKLYVATEEEIDAALEQYYGGTGKPAEESAPAESSGRVTGEGDNLEQRYDPTLSGEDSGLYAPQSEDDPPPGDVGLAELDYEGGGVGSDSGRIDKPVRSHVRDTLDNAAIAAQADLDESTLGGPASDSESRQAEESADPADQQAPGDADDAGDESSQPADELDLGGTGSTADSGQDDGGSGIDTGPEEHDPFQE